MGLGIIGTSGVGKTTLARNVAKLKGIDFVESVVRPTYAELGFDAGVDYNFNTRLMIQEKIIENSEKSYAERKSYFVTDRTPICFASYLLADVQRENLSEEETERVMTYLERCIRITNLYFNSLVVVQPGIAFESREHRPKNVAYNEHVNMLMIGIFSDGRVLPTKHIIGRDVIDLKRRISLVLKIAAINDKVNENQMKSCIIN